jgi:hypothetical protein
MAGNAIVSWGSVFGLDAGVAGFATLIVSGARWGYEGMWVMAEAAPEFVVAGTRASA